MLTYVTIYQILITLVGHDHPTEFANIDGPNGHGRQNFILSGILSSFGGPIVRQCCSAFMISYIELDLPLVEQIQVLYCFVSIEIVETKMLFITIIHVLYPAFSPFNM